MMHHSYNTSHDIISFPPHGGKEAKYPGRQSSQKNQAHWRSAGLTGIVAGMISPTPVMSCPVFTEAGIVGGI